MTDLNWQPPNSNYPPPKPGEPELHRAARLGDLAAIRACVTRGDRLDSLFEIQLDPGARPSPASPLMVAAGSGAGAGVETVRLLLDLGADPSQQAAGSNALTFACSGLGWNYPPGGDVDRMRLLWEAGCRLPQDLKTQVRLVADVAGQGDARRLAQLLEWGAPVDPAPLSDRAARETTAAAWGMDGEEEEFPGGGFADSPPAWFDFEIPLFRAAASGHVECVRQLLEAGARPDIRNSSGETALFHAGSEAVARYLVEAGLSTEAVNGYGWTPLVANVGDPGRVRTLLAVGADVNARHDQGYTVFMSAVGSNRHPESLRLLIAAGADPHAVSELGYNAYHAAIDVNFEANAENSVRDTLHYLHELQVNLEQRNHRGLTPLGRAIEEGTVLEVRVLCALGADVNAVARASRSGNESAGADGPRLLFAAIQSAVEPDQKVECLLQAGADPQVVDEAGRSPLDTARDRLRELRSWEVTEFTDQWLREAQRTIELLESARPGG